ncbi:YihY family inner membrane protein [Pandoraea thiooxydans]|uniref:YihY family inner membrane protein n=1 Tax=Pandoraea thiooxydans TaxID=445709 RepID=UPI000B0A7811|nr:YihY family inner membrane protein [Pandoraea thiooxydans]
MHKPSRLDFESIREIVRFVMRRSREDRIPQIAGSLTFTTVLALVPLLAVAFALFTAFPMFNTFRDALQGFLLSHLMPDTVNDQIFRYLNQFAAKAKSLTTVGLIGLLLTSVATMMTIESVFNVIWRVPRPRPLAQRVLVYWAILTLGPLLFGVSLSISSYALSQSMSLVHTLPLAVAWPLGFLPVLLSAVAFTLLYLYMPHCRVDWRDALTGGTIAALAFEIAKRGFALYIKKFPTYTAVYGAFAAIPIFLLWVYLSWLVTLWGATLTAVLPSFRERHFHHREFPGSYLLDALTILSALDKARDGGKPGLTQLELARQTHSDLTHAAKLLGDLEQFQWIGRLANPKGPDRWVLLVNPETASLERLIVQLTIDFGELSQQLTRRQLDGERIATMLREGRWDVPLAQVLRQPAA